MQRSTFLATFTATMLLAGAAHAQTADHLQCFKIKDSAAKASYTADITPSDPAFAGLEPGCTVQVPAKLLCVDAVKSNVDPTPPGAPEGVPLQKFLCYKTKCAKFSASGDLTDQFGDHSVTTKSGGLLCAPVTPLCTDADTDTYCAEVDDCDDTNAGVRPGATETCDGLDNDCDGTTDDGNPGGGQACATGLVGVCSTGTTTCSGGAVTCGQDVSASAETCDGLDNDCDGAIDNGNPGGGQACSTGLVGVCSAGTTTCSGGAVTCGQDVSASAETCDGLDNDCDGAIDNGNPGGGQACSTGLVGVCSAGTTTCSGGAVTCGQDVSSSAETCDGLDNDCNGVVDNGNPGGGQACSTGLPGVCSPGTTTCSGGALACGQNVASSSEVCDGLDNNCDGTVDGNTRGCYTGPAGTSGVGTCRSGTQTCTLGSWGGTCPGQVIPVAEVCGDGLDNNCDGVVNNGCP